MSEDIKEYVKLSTWHVIECYGPDGKLKWREEDHNLVVTAGLNELLDKTFKASSYTAAWYVGLKGTGTVAAGDTMASHAGWAELTNYSESNRPTLTLGTVASGSVSNTASKAVFSISSDATVAGAFVTNNNTKGGTTGTLYGASNFTASRDVKTGDTLNVEVTLNTTAA